MHCAPVDGPRVCCVGSSRALTGSADRLYARQLRDVKESECAVLWHCTALGGRATKWQARRLESAARSARRREDTGMDAAAEAASRRRATPSLSGGLHRPRLSLSMHLSRAMTAARRSAVAIANAWMRSCPPTPTRRPLRTKRGRRRSPFAQLSLSTAQHAPRPGRGDGWPRHPPLRRRRVSFRRERVGSERAARPIARRADNCATPHIGPSVLGRPWLSASGWSRVIFRASPRWRDGSCRGTSTSPT